MGADITLPPSLGPGLGCYRQAGRSNKPHLNELQLLCLFRVKTALGIQWESGKGGEELSPNIFLLEVDKWGIRGQRMMAFALAVH